MSEAVGLELVWATPDPFDLRAWVESHREGARWLSRPEVLARARPGSARRDALLQWCQAQGMHHRPGGPFRSRFRASQAVLRESFGRAAADALLRRDPGRLGLDLTAALPPQWRGLVARIDVTPPEAGTPRSAHRELLEPRPGVSPRSAATSPAACRAALGCAEFDLEGRGQHIAIMSLGGAPRADDLRSFCGAFDLGPLDLEQVTLGALSNAAREHPLYRHETTMLIQWAHAIAPQARITVVTVDAEQTADPWAAFYEELLEPSGVPATVAVTTWSAPEGQYRRAHGREVSAVRLTQLAAVGVTVVVASGDWGVAPGFPSRAYRGRQVYRSTEPEVVYPACEPLVVSVGGTCGFGADARALRCALSPALAAALPIGEIASSGGFSREVPIPAWQRPHLAPTYRRGASQPAVFPSGRGVPDVALPAWGTPSDPHASCGYAGYVDGAWRDDIGGTSLGAAVFGALLALVNEARARRGWGPTGWCTPRLYALASARPDAFTSVRRGTSDVALPVLDASGAPTEATVPGFVAGEGWDPLTGLGLPRLDPLLWAMAPSADVIGDDPRLQRSGAVPQHPGGRRELLDAGAEQLEASTQAAAHRSAGDPQRLLERSAPDLLEVVQLERDLEVDGDVSQGLEQQLLVLPTLEHAAR